MLQINIFILVSYYQSAILCPEKILQIKLMSPYWFIPSQKLRKS